MHPINSKLPGVYAKEVLAEDAKNRSDIDTLLTKMESPNYILDSKDFSRCLRLMDHRLVMKYERENAFISLFMQRVLRIMERHEVATPLRSKAFKICTKLMKNEKIDLTMEFHWQPYWDELISICKRTNDRVASDSLNGQLFEAMLGFLHLARRFVAPDEASLIAIRAMELLQDTRTALCIEGLQLLVVCLPTSFDAYDAYLPQWVALLEGICGNRSWDACWLTLLCRARKHSTSFDWSSLVPLLQRKLRDLLRLPCSNTTLGNKQQQAPYPFNFPHHYSVLKTSMLDYGKVAIKKTIKLLYWISCSTDFTCSTVDNPSLFPISPPYTFTSLDVELPGVTVGGTDVRSSAVEFVKFLASLRVFMHPSNIGLWTQDISYMVTALVTELSQHVGQGMYAKLTHTNSTVDIATVKYMGGSLAMIALEGLFGKSPFMHQCSAIALKNLCALDPALGDLIVPFLLDALRPGAVNRSHMAPAALYALMICTKHLLHPSPVALPYLSDILHLALVGIDPNDAMKTTTALSLFVDILAWLPQGFLLSENDMLHGKNGLPVDIPSTPNYLNIATCDSIESLCAATPSSVYRDRVTRLQEELLNWPLQFIERIYAILQAKELPQKSASGGRSQAAADADTRSSYIEECMALFSKSLSSSMREEVLKHVIGFALRTSLTNAAKELGKVLEALVSDQPELLEIVLQQVAGNDDFLVNVSELSTDKLTYRLRLLAGAFRRATGDAVVSSKHVQHAIDVLTSDALVHHTDKDVRKMVSKLVKDVLRCLTGIYPRSIKSADVSFGHPNVIADTDIIWHVPSSVSLAYATQLLDRIAVGAIQAMSENMDNATVASKKQEEVVLTHMSLLYRCLRGAAEALTDGSTEMKSAAISAGHLMHTRQQYIDSVLPQSVTLNTLRCEAAKFLNKFYQYYAGDEDAKTRGLMYSAPIWTLWGKSLHVLLCRRMSFLKNVDELKQSLKVWKRLGKCVVAVTMEKLIRKHHTSAQGEGWVRQLLLQDYWHGHNTSLRNISDRVWMQYTLRQKELSAVAMRALLNAKDGNVFSGELLKALQNLTRLCDHEYIGVRGKAIGIFIKIAPRFGWRMDAVIENKLQVLSSGSAVFGAVAGSANILSVDFVMKRIINDWNLSTKFLHALAQCDSMIATIENQSDRKAVADRVGDLFSRYIALWHKSSTVTSDSYEQLISRFLSELGHIANGATSSKGLRQELYLATAVLLYAADVTRNAAADIWRWGVMAASQKFGEPLQQIGLAITSKLAHHGYLVPTTVSFWEKEWPQYLTGILHGHRSLAENGPAQWSRGIDVILQVAESHRNLWPTMLHHTIALYSRSFSVVNAGIVFHLLKYQHEAVVPGTLVSVLAAAQSLPSTSEEETIQANSTRAELFGGCARYLAWYDGNKTELWVTLLQFFTENVARVTGDQLYDWSAAILFVCYDMEAARYLPLAECIVRNITVSAADAGSNSSAAEEGFTRVCNNLHLARVLCHGLANRSGSDADVAARRLVAEIRDANIHLFGSPYRVVRHDFAAVMANLALATLSPLHEYEELCKHFVNYSEDTAVEKKQISRDVIAKFVQSLMPVMQLGRCKDMLPSLLPHVIRGCSSGDIDFSKSCHSVCIQIASSYRIRCSSRDIDAVLQCFADNVMNESLHVRETCIAAISAIFGNNNMLLNDAERKLCRDVLMKGFCDAKPEVQLLSQAGMVVYLSSKSLDEVANLTASYVKNLDILSQREKKRRKAGEVISEKPDDIYCITIMMAACILRVYPYDVPKFIPSLVCGLVRHTSAPYLHATVTATIRDFKRTHQDRWDEYKHLFSHEQLEDLQGAGAAHYFS